MSSNQPGAGTSSTSVKVAVRVRPMAAKELLANSKDCVEIIPGTSQIIIGGGPASAVGTETIYNFTQKSFTFDYLFDDNTSQEDLYNLSVAPLVDRFMEGFNATILAYGQTGSGKTYSMGIGLDGIAGPIDLNYKGIVPRAISTIFSRIAALKQENASFEATVAVSFMELYNEELVDLLNPRPRSASVSANNGPAIREDGSGKIVWVNLSEEKVDSTAELLNILQKGTLCRTTGSTDMNATSSRSHAIFTVTLKQSYIASSPTDGSNSEEFLGSRTSLVSKFHFVDLAGSERLKRTNAEGDRKKEGISINQGLLALGNVISALGDETRKAAHIPYRDSKLTRMLQDSLGGNSQTLMLACVSPSDMNYGETVNTLHYANRARNIKNRVAINQDWGSSAGGEAQREIKSLRATISQLRTEIAMIRAGGIEIQEAEENSGLAMTNLVGQTKLHFHQRRERDHLAEMERLKSESLSQTFQLDRYQFLSVRLARQLRQLMEENARIAIERDVAIAQKCRAINPTNGFKIDFKDQKEEIPIEKKQKLSRDAFSEESLGKRSHDDESHDVHPIIKGYIQTVSQLRLQLADCEDKLAWQYEAMSKLGQKGTKSNLSLSLQNLKALDIATSPSQKRFDELKNDEGRSEAVGEKKLLEAIRENIELNEATNRDYPILSSKLMRDSNTDIISHSSLLQNETQIDNIDDLNDHSDSRPQTRDQQGPDIYMLINKLQNDIAQHEALAESIKKREAEYDRMQKAYESKLSVLQNQMAQFQQERDCALKKMSNSTKQQRSDAKSRFEETKRRLDSEISDTRRKMGENSIRQSNSKSRAEKLTSELQATIAALKGEKMRMLHDLRIQTQKHRDSNNANMREISKLRRKEKTTSDIAKKLERSNQLQRLMLKKRNQEVIQTQNKLKQIMQSLKRTSTPNKIAKASHMSGFASPAPRNIKTAKSRIAMISDPTMNEFLASVNSPVRVSVSQTLTDVKPDVDIKAQFKKQMVDKELAATVSCRKIQKTLQRLQKVRNRLTEEQKELIAERKRVIDASYRESGVYDDKTPQYMDERVQSIDVEVASIDNSMIELEETLKANSGSLDSGYLADSAIEAVDLNWENALNILRSLDRIELETTLAYFLEDLVSLRSLQDEYRQELEAKEQAASNLKQQLEELQESLYSQMKKHVDGNLADGIEDHEDNTIGDTLKNAIEMCDLVDIDDIDEKSSSSFIIPPKLSQEYHSATEDSLRIPLAIRIPSPSRKNGVRPIAISPSPPKLDDEMFPFRSRSLPRPELSPSFRKDRPLSPIKEISRPGSSRLPNNAFPTTLLSTEEEPKSKKKYEIMSMGGSGDVFQRLANAHTQASQAKVIQRSTAIDKDALMQDLSCSAILLSASSDGRKKSLTEMENSWHE